MSDLLQSRTRRNMFHWSLHNWFLTLNHELAWLTYLRNAHWTSMGPDFVASEPVAFNFSPKKLSKCRCNFHERENFLSEFVYSLQCSKYLAYIDSRSSGFPSSIIFFSTYFSISLSTAAFSDCCLESLALVARIFMPLDTIRHSSIY